MWRTVSKGLLLGCSKLKTEWLTRGVAGHQVVPNVEPELEVPGAVAEVDLPASQVQAVLHMLVPGGKQDKLFRHVTWWTSGMALLVAPIMLWHQNIRQGCTLARAPASLRHDPGYPKPPLY